MCIRKNFIVIKNYHEDVCQPTPAIFNFTYNTFLGFNEETTFFTIKEGPRVTPGGVGKDLQLWVKADSGLVLTGAVAWKDLSGFGRNMTYATGSACNIVPGSLNFNDYLENSPGTYNKSSLS